MTELSPEARKLLEAAREAFSPDEERVTAVRAAIAARASTPPPPPGQPWTAGEGAVLKGAGWGLPHLVGMGLLVAAGAGAALVGYGAITPEPAAPPPPAVQPAGAAVPAASLDPGPEAALPAEATPVAEPPSPAAAAEPRPSRVPRDRSARAKTGAERETGAKQGPASPAPDQGEQADAPLPEDSLLAEMALLRAARGALKRGNAAASLSWLDRHERSYPRGKLRPERLVTRVLALCELGRVAAARAAAAELRRVAPRSNYPRQISASCAGEPGSNTVR